MQGLGTGRNACHHTVPEPRETATHGTADPAERDARPQQVFHARAPLSRHEAVVSRGTPLPCARLTLMILLPRTGMAIFLVPA